MVFKATELAETTEGGNEEAVKTLLRGCPLVQMRARWRHAEGIQKPSLEKIPEERGGRED